MKVKFEDLVALIDCATKGSIEIVIGGFSDYDDVISNLETGFHPKADGRVGYDFRRDDEWLEIFHEDMTGHIDRHAIVDLSHKEYLRVKVAVLD